MSSARSNVWPASLAQLSVVALMVALLCALGLAATGCTGDDAGDQDGEETTAQDSASDATPDADEILATLEAEYGSEVWFEHIESIELEQMLLATVAIVSTDLVAEPGDTYSYAAQIANAVIDAADGSCPNARVVSSDGVEMAGASVGGVAADSLDLPSAPANAETLRDWIDIVFGGSGEQWVDHITSMEITTDYPGWQDIEVMVVSTDLADGSTKENQRIARLIGMAIDMSGQTLVSEYAVTDTDGTNITAGDIPPASFAY